MTNTILVTRQCPGCTKIIVTPVKISYFAYQVKGRSCTVMKYLKLNLNIHHKRHSLKFTFMYFLGKRIKQNMKKQNKKKTKYQQISIIYQLSFVY